MVDMVLAFPRPEKNCISPACPLAIPYFPSIVGNKDDDPGKAFPLRAQNRSAHSGEQIVEPDPGTSRQRIHSPPCVDPDHPARQ